MKITINKIKGNFDNKECFVHARACAIDDNNLIMTMQKLNLSGCDDFAPLVVLKSFDGGKTWTEPEEDSAFITKYDEEGVRTTGCDATHLMHKKTYTPIITGTLISFLKESKKPLKDEKRYTFYSTYDIENKNYRPAKTIEVPESLYPNGCAVGCSQFIELENGDILLPVSIKEKDRENYKTAVMCCSFDGKTLEMKQIGNELSFHIDRGLYEGSICSFKGKYYLTLRNDEYGLYSVSDDGLHFAPADIWKWDSGDFLPNYNTQQHWLECGGKLYLIYTRKAENNGHIPRHRAPLFMAEVNTEKMCLLRNTEKIVVPERGARLGNFGVTQVNKNKAIITAAEWMQPLGCEKYGCDNSIFITTVEA